MLMKPQSVASIVAGIVAISVVLYFILKFEQFYGFVAGFASRGGPADTQVMTAGETIVMRTPGGLLEVARIKAYERLVRSSPGDTIAWGYIGTGTTVSEIEVPALYRYHIEMAVEWKIRCDRGTCVVRSGAIQPAFPPAVYSDEIRKQTTSGWARFDKNGNLDLLEKSMTAELSKRASSERNVQAATDAGRRTVQEFVRTWLLKTRLAAGESAPRIVVLFPGESINARADAY